jgi:DNA-binding NtrC family response regulator
MSGDEHPETIDDELPWGGRRATPQGPSTRLLIAWSLDEPERLGESAEINGPVVLGRGDIDPADDRPRARFGQARPGVTRPGPALAEARLSRQQLLIDPLPQGRLALRSIGRCRMFVNGVETSEAQVGDGDTVLFRNALLLLVARRPPLPALRQWSRSAHDFAFGTADPFGIVGESAAAWTLRDQLAVVAGASLHVLIHGPSGAGKELAARAIHRLSRRAERPLVARNAATFTDTLIDAELFGNIKNFPNVGTPERIGLIGEADRSSLFLDEIGELPTALQAHLLRLLDRDGEYHRLGEAKPRKADVRVLAATNRDIETLKHDFLARLTARVSLPPLAERPEDVPLIARHVLEGLADRSPELALRFFERRHGKRAEARVMPELMAALVRHPWALNIRELERVLWVAVSTSHGDYIGLGPETQAELLKAQDKPPERGVSEVVKIATPRVELPDRERVVAALAAAKGRVAQASNALGLTSRYVLYRLMRQYGLAEQNVEQA